MKNNKYLLIIAVLVVMAIAVVINMNASKKETVKLLLPNEKEYTEKANQYISKMLIRQANAMSNNEEEQKKKSEKYWRKATGFSQAQLTDVELYGKVVDQHNNPVPGVRVMYSATDYYLAEGTGAGYSATDANGVFVIDDAKGKYLNIYKLEKNGYKFKFYHEGRGPVTFDGFKQSSTSKVWFDYTRDKPYVFKAWKVDKYPPKLKSVNDRLYIKPDGQKYTLDFSKKWRYILRKGETEGDLRLSMNRTDDAWTFKIAAIDGGLQETNDFFLNQAPESGYQNSIEYSYAKQDKEKLKRGKRGQALHLTY